MSGAGRQRNEEARLPTRGPAGFTLLEIAVALAILGVGMVACMQIFGGSLRLEERSAREGRAALYARGLMDELLVRPPDRLRDGEEIRPPTADGFRARRLVRVAGAAEGVAQHEFAFQSDLVLRYLEVEVAWQEGAAARTYALRSMRITPADE